MMGKYMDTMADLAVEMAIDDDELDDLEAAVEAKRLQRDVSEIYVRGQIPSIRDSLHLSDVINRHQCPRKLVLLHYYTQDQLIHGHQLSARFATGIDIHKRWQANVQRAIPEAQIEQDHMDKIWGIFSFHPDIIAPFRGEPHVWELKGYRDDEFVRLTQKGKLPKEAIIQNMLYQWLAGIPRGLVIVENKNTQAFHVWRIVLDMAMIKPYEKTLGQIAEMIRVYKETGELPDRLEECVRATDDTPKGCASCSACFASKEQRIQLRRPVVWE